MEHENHLRAQSKSWGKETEIDPRDLVINKQTLTEISHEVKGDLILK